MSTSQENIISNNTSGMLHEDWTFISSVYYGVTAMSTGGLQTPNARSAFSMMFTGIYVLVGVPLYVVILCVCVCVYH